MISLKGFGFKEKINDENVLNFFAMKQTKKRSYGLLFKLKPIFFFKSS